MTINKDAQILTLLQFVASLREELSVIITEPLMVETYKVSPEVQVRLRETIERIDEEMVAPVDASPRSVAALPDPLGGKCAHALRTATLYCDNSYCPNYYGKFL